MLEILIKQLQSESVTPQTSQRHKTWRYSKTCALFCVTPIHPLEDSTVTLTSGSPSNPAAHFLHAHKHTHLDDHTFIHSPTLQYRGQIERWSQTPHHGSSLWLPFCELFTHVEADPSAQRDGEK